MPRIIKDNTGKEYTFTCDKCTSEIGYVCADVSKDGKVRCPACNHIQCVEKKSPIDDLIKRAPASEPFPYPPWLRPYKKKGGPYDDVKIWFSSGRTEYEPKKTPRISSVSG